MIPLSIPNLCGKEAAYLQQCIDTNYVSSVGSFVKRFEHDIAMVTKAEYACMVTSGTAALHIALKAANVKQGDMVIVPSLTFIASANAIMHCGATPYFIDIDLASWTLDSALLGTILQHETYSDNNILYHSKTKKPITAILPVCTLGACPDLDNITSLAHQYNIKVILDAAGAIGATYKQQSLGQLDVDAVIISFNGNKTMTSGGGGVVLTNNQVIYEYVKHISTTARIDGDYTHDMVGYNYRMTNLQAAVGCAQLENLPYFLERKLYIYNYYRESLQQCRHIVINKTMTWRQDSYWLSSIMLEHADMIDSFISYMTQCNIEVRKFWKPMHYQEPYKNMPGSTQDNTNMIWARIVTLPSSTNISDDDLHHVTGCIVAWDNTYNA